MAKSNVDRFIKNPRKVLFTLAIPIAIGMLIQAMYEFADTAFVGRLGADAIAALTFSFPLFFILIAFNVGLSAGMGSRISRFLGEKSKKEAENAAFHGLLISIALAIISFLSVTFVLRNIFVIFGASGQTLELSLDYMSIILLGVFFIFPEYALSSIFQAEGDTKTIMYIQIASLLLNIILDPILIYGAGLGVRGAAIATFIAFLFSFLLYIYYIHKKSYLKIKWSSFKYSSRIIWDILKVGAPATLMVFILSFYVIFLNKFMAHFGTNYIAAFGLASQLESIAVIPIVAFSSAILTLIGMFYGAKKHNLLRDTSVYGLKAVALLTSIIGVIFFALSPFLFRIFTDDKIILGLSASYMRIDVLTFPLMGIVTTVSRIMQGFGDGSPGLVLNIVRIFVVALPLAYLFVFGLGFGFLSVAWAMVSGGAIASIISIVWLNLKLKRIDKKYSLI